MKSRALAEHFKGILLLIGVLVATVCTILLFSVDSLVHLSYENVDEVVRTVLANTGTLLGVKTFPIGGDIVFVQ